MNYVKTFEEIDQEEVKAILECKKQLIIHLRNLKERGSDKFAPALRQSKRELTDAFPEWKDFN